MANCADRILPSNSWDPWMAITGAVIQDSKEKEKTQTGQMSSEIHLNRSRLKKSIRLFSHLLF